MNKKKEPVNRLALIQSFLCLSSDIRMMIEGSKGDFYAKVLQLNALAEEYLDFIRDKPTLTDEGFLAIITMIKACLFLNLKVFKHREESKEMIVFREKNSDFEMLNSPDTDAEVWKGIKAVLYGHEYDDAREEYRELIREPARIFLGMFNDGDLDHLEIFLPVGHMGTKEYVQEHFEHIAKWAKMPLKKFQNYIKTLSPEDLRTLEMELASIKKERDFPEGIKWGIQARKKKLRAVRCLRFRF